MNTYTRASDAVSFSSRFIPLGAKIGHMCSRIRFQLGGAILIGVIAPIIARNYFEMFPDQLLNYQNSVLGTLASVLIGYMMYRKVSALPGAGTFMNILPAFLSSYTMVAAVFFAIRLGYSRSQFLMSFLLVLAWFYAFSAIRAAFAKRRYLLVASQSGYADQHIRGLDCVITNDIAQAEEHADLPIIVDFSSAEISEDWERYLAEQAISGRQVFNSRQILESIQGRVMVRHLSENSFGHLAPDSIFAPAKRYLDLISATLVLIALSPMLAILGLLIKMESKGPAIFRQTRIGFRGEKFTMYKFRSMREKTPEELRQRESDITKDDDDRITKIGQFIRLTRLDELPQLINIIRGEMSWIGPRPETVALSEWYEKEIPFYRYRHIVRPGITGWAQINQGHVASIGDVKTKLEYDFFYVKYFSLWTDILILVQTVRVMISGSGAR